MRNLSTTPRAKPSKRRYLPAGERKRSLLEHGLALVQEEGWENLSVIRLARLAGVSRQLVYEHFPNVDELTWQLADRLYEEVCTSVAATIRAHPNDLEAALREWVRTYFAGLQERRLAHMELVYGHWPLRQLNRSLEAGNQRRRHRIMDMWADYFVGVNGLSPKNAQALAAFQYGGFQGLLGQMEAGFLSAEETADLFVEILRSLVERLGGRF